MGIVEYKLEKGCICVTPCPALMKKEDGDFVLVGSTACMLCKNHSGQTYYEDETGGMVKCTNVQGPNVQMRGVKEKPSLTRALKDAAEAVARGREIRAKRREMAEKLREARLKREEQLKEMGNEED